MKKDKFVSGLILKKSTKFLKISILLFAFSLMMIASFLVSFLNQYLQIEKDFINNNNTHIIEISAISKNNSSRELKFEDQYRIIEAVTQQNQNLEYRIIHEYQFNFGMEDSEGDIYFLYGLDDTAANLLGVSSLEDYCLYSSLLTQKEITLHVPIIDVKEGGLSSSRVENKKFKTNHSIIENNPFSIYESTSSKNFISFNTYRKLIEMIYNISWEDYVIQFDESNPFGIQSIHKIYVYIDDLTKVEKAAKEINLLGYATNYTFKSFENFDESIKNTMLISAVLISTIFLITAVYIILSFNSYLKVQQKDMGILKHYGYYWKNIHRIYARNINGIFAGMSIFIIIFTIIIGFIFINISSYVYIIFILIVILALLFTVNRIISIFILRSYVRKEIIELIKTNKEFE